MKITLVHPVPSRRWHGELAARLRAKGHDVRMVAGRSAARIPFGIDLALTIERRLLRLRDTWWTRCRMEPVAPPTVPHDLKIILDGSDSGEGPALEPRLDGRTCDEELAALLDPRGTRGFALRATRDGATTDLIRAVLAVEEPDVASRAIDRTLRRIVALVAHGVDLVGEGRPGPASPAEDVGVPRRSPRLLLPFVGRLCRKIWRRLRKTAPRDHWAIGFRSASAQPFSPDAGPDARAWTMLVDDGLRFCADPVPFEQDGRTVLFFEDFPYATRKGVIGAVDVAADGSVSTPRTVLETRHHLSYPFVLAHRGAIYMLPEAAQARRVELFRAAPFPDTWVPDRILIDDITASDATPIFFDGRWWMFATLADDGGSTWDQLGLFHAPDLFGPWTPHAGNPVLVDAGSARPGGPMWVDDGRLMRVAQDCRHGYGRGLVLCRVDTLTEDAFAQTVVARRGPPAGEADGIHTLSRTAAWEFIDLHFSGPAERRWAVPRVRAHG